MKSKVVSISVLLPCVFFVKAQQVKDTVKKEMKIEEVELFGEKYKQPKGLDVITRLPLKPRDQIQSISVISYKVIEELGGLSITDVAKNVPGVTQFSTYGGTRESMSIRGYRGVPVLKNGISMDSDFRTAGILTDMQGVESIQVIKGSAAVTQGIGDGLGSAGGVINVTTKVPNFINQTNIGFRYGSWDLYRLTVDFQRVLDSDGKVAVRLNAAYQDSNSFRAFVNTNRVYINPSIAYRPDNKTEIIMEMDYMNNNTTPDRGTVNFGKGDVNKLYTMPKGKFLGFSTDNAETETFNFSTRVVRKINDKLRLRAAYIASSYDLMNTVAVVGKGEESTGYAERARGISRYSREDRNQVFQFDFIGADVKTGFLKHTFQVGFDWKQSNVTTVNYKPKNPNGDNINSIDVINVLENISNTLPYEIIYTKGTPVNTIIPVYGAMVQDVITVNKYVKAHLGIRYSKSNFYSEQKNYAWNPSFGLMVSPIENVNIFGSYTTTTSLRSAADLLQGGGTVGPSETTQWETGIKSDWFGERLRFNVTLFDIDNKNLSYSILNSGGNETGLYGLAGNLRRKGMEVELIGRILPNLQIMTGWAYLDAQYQNSPAFINGSAPMNAPKHSANAWLNYHFDNNFLKGLDVGVGAYYVGERPVDNHQQKTFISGYELSVTPGLKPFMMKAYTTVEAQLGYTYKNAAIRVFFNNILDAIGYSSYFRGGYIDQIQPRNFAVQLNYKF